MTPTCLGRGCGREANARTHAQEDLVEARVPLQRDHAAGHAQAAHEAPGRGVEEEQRAALAAAVRARAGQDQALVGAPGHLPWGGGAMARK